MQGSRCARGPIPGPPPIQRSKRLSHGGFRVSGFRLRVTGFGFRVSGFGFRVPGSGFRVSGFGFRGSGFRFQGLEVRIGESDAASTVLHVPYSLDRVSGFGPEMCSGSEAGSYLRLIDFCITQLRVKKEKKTSESDATRTSSQEDSRHTELSRLPWCPSSADSSACEISVHLLSVQLL